LENISLRKAKRVSIFAELVLEKISSTVYQGLWKEQKRNSDVYQAERRKGNADDYHAIEK
jgi:hypothetical protein